MHGLSCPLLSCGLDGQCSLTCSVHLKASDWFLSGLIKAGKFLGRMRLKERLIRGFSVPAVNLVAEPDLRGPSALSADVQITVSR